MSTDKFRSGAVLLLGALAGWYAVGRPLDLHGVADGMLGRFSACGSTYRVVPGDTLHKIATRAYGHGDYQAIYEANRNTLTSAARVNVGDELLIPCRDNARSIATAPKPAPPEAAPAPLVSLPPDRPGRARAAPVAPVISAAAITPDLGGGSIRFITGSDFAPFVHSDLPGNGMATEMIRLAMARAAPRREVELTLVADWPAHLDLLADGVFDVGFPWYRPDCARADRLSPAMRRRCTGFDFSAPLFEVAIGYYVRKDDPLARQPVRQGDYGALSGRRICRPASHFTFDLEQQGLARPDAALVFPPASDDCFALLAGGAVDVVTLSRPIAAKSLMQLGLVGRVVEIPTLASRQTLHAIAAKANPRGRAYLDLVDAGTAKLHETGRWFEIASRHFGAFGVRPQ